jgi:hypothetical protein
MCKDNFAVHVTINMPYRGGGKAGTPVALHVCCGATYGKYIDRRIDYVIDLPITAAYI